jgi:superfamily II DNA or RNA helicase
MNRYLSDFRQSLETGFINRDVHSDHSYRPQFLVNDKLKGVKVLSSILNELNACTEFWFSVAFVTQSGIATLIETLKDLEDKGIKGKILVSQYLNFTQPEALSRLISFSNIEVRIDINNNFHSKGYLFKQLDHYNLIVGSSNLTASALCSNKEWNLKVSAKFDSDIMERTLHEFSTSFNGASVVDYEFISNYKLIYFRQRLLTSKLVKPSSDVCIEPNMMQKEALLNLKHLREENKSKALLISATGTGKTYLSAFDIKSVNPKRVLFVVHRLNIAKAAMKTFKSIFGDSKSMGLFSGSKKDLYADFVFSTVQTISKDSYMHWFSPNRFDYIVIDETHRAGANSYQRVLDYFTPSFLLGMTATPERMDGLDIFKLFDHNIAYEIRLHSAMEANMLSPFHYYGVTDIQLNGETLKEKADFRHLVSEERANRIVEKAKFYGCDDGEVRGLVFCSGIEEASELSSRFNERGYNTLALCGNDSESVRESAIARLELEACEEKLDYIFTVDIFNEGIDIPRVNQIILLRPTQSAIIFIQQLGRGLRKVDNKDYLTVIDFIGNYEKNYLVPVALFGDTSYNKDRLRKLMAGGNCGIPGDSTINFDRISKEQIFKAIDSANMQMKKDLVHDYSLLKYKIGRMPMMMDFIEHGSRDPQLYINYSRSYFNFVAGQEKEIKSELDAKEMKLLELFSREINNSKRVEESLILKELLIDGELSVSELKEIVRSKYNYILDDASIVSCVANLNFEFVTERVNKKLVSSREANDLHIAKLEGDIISIDRSLEKALKKVIFREFLRDSILYSIHTYDFDFSKSVYNDGFILYKKYSRKDVFRLLNWVQNPVAQNVGGYLKSPDGSNCPIFVTYHKDEGISSTTKYEDHFVNNVLFSWMSKNKRNLESPDVKVIMNYRDGLRLPLFIQKSNDEGLEFYYMGDLTPIDDSFTQAFMTSDNDKKVSVVKVDFKLSHPVEDALYGYLTCS